MGVNKHSYVWCKIDSKTKRKIERSIIYLKYNTVIEKHNSFHCTGDKLQLTEYKL